MLCVDKELRLDAREIPRAEWGVEVPEANALDMGVEVEGGAWGSTTGTDTFGRSRLTSFRSLVAAGGSELLRKSNSMSSSTSCSLFLRLTKPEEALPVLVEEVAPTLEEPRGVVVSGLVEETLLALEKRGALDLLMLPAAAVMKPGGSWSDS
jgi:hypothetical protein